MNYQVKEIYYTLQGEGVQSGRPSVFCRFSGCNLWSGLEDERNESRCSFCDTDFTGQDGQGGGTYDAFALTEALAAAWPGHAADKQVVFTGGEPLLQLDAPLVAQVKAAGFACALETNGTLSAPGNLDWITVSPKQTELAQAEGDELKLVFPTGLDPRAFEHFNFRYFLLSPLFTKNDAINRTNLEQAIRYCLDHPRWQLTMQHHRLWGLR